MQRELLYTGMLDKEWKKVNFHKLDKILQPFKKTINKLVCRQLKQEVKSRDDFSLSLLLD